MINASREVSSLVCLIVVYLYGLLTRRIKYKVERYLQEEEFSKEKGYLTNLSNPLKRIKKKELKLRVSNNPIPSKLLTNQDGNGFQLTLNLMQHSLNFSMLTLFLFSRVRNMNLVF